VVARVTAAGLPIAADYGRRGLVSEWQRGWDEERAGGRGAEGTPAAPTMAFGTLGQLGTGTVCARHSSTLRHHMEERFAMALPRYTVCFQRPAAALACNWTSRDRSARFRAARTQVRISRPVQACCIYFVQCHQPWNVRGGRQCTRRVGTCGGCLRPRLCPWIESTHALARMETPDTNKTTILLTYQPKTAI
jgi:hypothetical protein